MDLACGDGRTTCLLRQLGMEVQPFDMFPQVYKLDDRPRPLDLQKPLPIADASVDVVVLQEVLEHLPNHLFTLQEIARILRPGGELFLTTPTRSSLVSKISHRLFESETLKEPPCGRIRGVWSDAASGVRCFGHLFMTGVQQLRAMDLIAGFRKFQVHRSAVSRSSMALLWLLYPLIWAVSRRAMC